MTFEPQNELERLLVDASKNEASRPAFLRAILEEKLFIITEGRKPSAPREEVTEQDSEITVRQIEIEGKLRTPIFSSESRVSAVIQEEVGYLAMKGRDLLMMVRGTELVLNPGSAYGKFFTPTEIESLLDGSIFNPAPAGKNVDVGSRQVMLGQPSKYPQHITDALGEFFSKRRDIEAAYLAHAHFAGDPTAHTVIGIETASEWKPLLESLGPVLNAALREGDTVDLLHLGKALEPIGDYMLKQTTPFYRRKKWLGLF